MPQWPLIPIIASACIWRYASHVYCPIQLCCSQYQVRHYTCAIWPNKRNAGCRISQPTLQNTGLWPKRIFPHFWHIYVPISRSISGVNPFRMDDSLWHHQARMEDALKHYQIMPFLEHLLKKKLSREVKNVDDLHKFKSLIRRDIENEFNLLQCIWINKTWVEGKMPWRLRGHNDWHNFYKVLRSFLRHKFMYIWSLYDRDEFWILHNKLSPGISILPPGLLMEKLPDNHCMYCIWGKS